MMSKKYFTKLYVRWLELRGKAINITLEGRYPAHTLSNNKNNNFVFDDVKCSSMESFLQSLKHQDIDTQKQVAAIDGKKARKYATNNWQYDQTLYWQGNAYKRDSEDYRHLIERAYEALYDQNVAFRRALIASKDKRLYYLHGRTDPKRTVLTQQEFVDILTDLRARHKDDKMFGMGARH